jgi:uncharacterized membrane protein
MTELVLAVYDRAETAEHVLGLLQEQADESPIDFDAGAIIRINANGAFTVTTMDRPASGGSFWGVFWEALFGLIFRVPRPGTAYGENLGGLFGAIDRAGLDSDFRARVRNAVGAPCSVLGFLAIDWNPDLVFDQAYLKPETLVRAALSPQQEAELLTELSEAPPPVEQLGAEYIDWYPA